LAPQTIERRHELDWLRIFAFFVLIFYYTGMPFIKGSAWGIVNAERSGLLSIIWHFLHTWRLPLLFTISGMGVAFALRKRSGSEFVFERVKRLLLPLAVGIMLFVPPQVFVKLLFEGTSLDSYLMVYPEYFNGWDPPGNFTFSHLWFLVVLFSFAIISLPIFLWLRTERGTRFICKYHELCETRFGFYLMSIPFVVLYYALIPISSGFWTDWKTFLFYFFVFIMGYLVASRPQLCESKERYRFTYLTATLLSFIAYFGFYYLERLKGIDLGLMPFFRILAVISLLLMLFGFARRYLNFPSRFLTYTNEAVYPYYLIQPTLIIVFSYIVISWPINWIWKFLLIVVSSYVVMGVVYHFFIRPFNPVRVLLGMKPKK
jgi:glucan biosynthesis protein C